MVKKAVKKVTKKSTESKTAKKAPAKRGRPKKSTTAKKKTSAKKTPAKRGRPKKVVEEVVEVAEFVEEIVEEVKSPLITENTRPVQWILNKQMQFGLINESFAVGTKFTVDWENHCMRCESNGIVYNNVRDLEIAISIGAIEPCGDEETEIEYQRRQAIEKAARESANKKSSESRESKDSEVRNMISRSDQDIVQSIDISHTRKQPTNRAANINVTPTSEVSILKPTPAKREMEVHYSDGAQQGQTVRSSNTPLMRDEVQTRVASGKPLSPVLSGQKSWDVSKSGQIQNEINQKLNDTSIVVDENGQQYIRGLPIIRDDSDVGMGAGSSLNQGMVTSLSPAQRAERSQKIQHIRSQKQEEVSQNRSQGGAEVADTSVVNNVNADVSSMMPQTVTAGVGISDQGISPIEIIKPIKASEDKKNTAGKLLRRRK
jgi:hypothetical protein